MKTIHDLIRLPVLILLALAGSADLTNAQEVVIADPGLEGAIHDALQIPKGPLTQQNLLALTNLDASSRGISNLQGLEAAHNLTALNLGSNALTSITFPNGLTSLTHLDLGVNPLFRVALAADMTHLTNLELFSDHLTIVILPPELTNLVAIDFSDNQFATLSLPPALSRLVSLNLSRNIFTNLTLPTGLTSLTTLDLRANQLSGLTLPPDLTKLDTLLLDGNPLADLVLSEPLAAVNLAGTVASLRNQRVSVFTYPLTIQLVRPRPLLGTFQFGITGPPGVYTVFSSIDLSVWNVVGMVNNPLGGINFDDLTASLPSQKFYRALLPPPPTNMVFIPANTFTLGTPAGELNRQSDEGPQTTVALSRGYWIGKYEVTQREYLAVVGSNPSGFPGDLDRPVETVSWLDATNYCARLTQQELAAGHIPPGSRFRLPTEAEWECAARAGTSTRFSYGDDPNLTNLADFAWFGANNGLGTHPVGQKAPNAWGLYDMEGNVWEWCQDWYGPYSGGTVVDPQGPASNPQGVKVIRGGAWESSGSDCRSGRRLTEGVSPFITDFIIGFRVVLVTEPQ